MHDTGLAPIYQPWRRQVMPIRCRALKLRREPLADNDGHRLGKVNWRFDSTAVDGGR